MNVRIARHSANVKGVPCDIGWLCPDFPPTTSEANRGGKCEGGITESLTSIAEKRGNDENW